jgi:YlmC/YmxH family sporulation protein
MRLSDLTGKEVINLSDGTCLGVIGECELTFDNKTGKIAALKLPPRSGILSLFATGTGSTVPWQAIRKIGEEVIIVDLSTASRSLLHFHREVAEDE